MDFIFEWVNQEYAKRFWQMDGRPIRQLQQTYEYILLSDFAQSFVALLHDAPVCQVDVYHALQDEVSLLYDAQEGDYGVHFLMAPYTRPISSLSSCVFQTFLEFFFSYTEVNRIIGEPDADNVHANRLVRKLGFCFQKQVSMSYKTANLYICTNDSFNAAISPQQEHLME
jgi:RimJ/RimL family protein N-acetyltransferase